jgi:hypothetical protein
VKSKEANVEGMTNEDGTGRAAKRQKQYAKP